MHRGDVQSQPTPTLGDELFGCGLGTEERAFMLMTINHLAEVVLGGIQQRGASLDAGVVDSTSSRPSTVAFHRSVDHLRQVRGLGHVGLRADRVTAGGPH